MEIFPHTHCGVRVGGPVAKVPFFQMVQISLLSVLIYSTRCEYDILKVLFLKNDRNLSVECVKHRNVPRKQKVPFYMLF